ncbi:YeeE/YedE [Endozoicomonas montiporae]|uniref:YeeE/YedE n=2 Tax=Endozoicomonas montiporae TaxID=1027273 RepID=A0A081N6W6_9GAMM|nr:YeeE/YedE [Endozoicomonas montiporae]
MPWNEIVNFTPIHGLAGGALLGLGAAVLLLFNGRIAGFSGIISSLRVRNNLWKLAFIAGALISGTVLHQALNLPAPESQLPASGLIIAGLLVGFGTRLGNGCTSGHGVCGLSRFSLRSLVAVMVFMASAMATVFVMRHL